MSVDLVIIPDTSLKLRTVIWDFEMTLRYHIPTVNRLEEAYAFSKEQQKTAPSDTSTSLVDEIKDICGRQEVHSHLR